MTPAKPTAATPRRAPKTPGKRAIIRAVASSTAIETGQSISQIERILRNKGADSAISRWPAEGPALKL